MGIFDFFTQKRSNDDNERVEKIRESTRSLLYQVENVRNMRQQEVNALSIYNKKLINSAKVIFTAMRNDAERGNLTASKVRAYRKKFFECEQDEQS